MTRHVLGTIPLILMTATAALCQGTRLGESCDLAALGAKETKTFLAFDQELRAALSKQDTAAMALLVKFPLRIHTDQGSWSLDDPAALQSRFEEAFPIAVRTAVLN